MRILVSDHLERNLLRTVLAYQHINPKLVISTAEVSIRSFFVNKRSALTANISLCDLGPVFKPSTALNALAYKKKKKKGTSEETFQ